MASGQSKFWILLRICNLVIDTPARSQRYSGIEVEGLGVKRCKNLEEAAKE